MQVGSFVLIEKLLAAMKAAVILLGAEGEREKSSLAFSSLL